MYPIAPRARASTVSTPLSIAFCGEGCWHEPSGGRGSDPQLAWATVCRALQHRRGGSRRLRWLGVLAAGLLAGCGLSEDGVGALGVDPGRYSAYHCKDLIDKLTKLQDREKELRGLMDKASDGGGGAVIGTLAYRTDYETTLSAEKLLRRVAAEKKCELAPAYQSDHAIR